MLQRNATADGQATAARRLAASDVHPDGRRGPDRRRGTDGRRGPARWSLRTRLLALLLALLAAISVVIVFVTAVALRGVLVEQIDERLRAANGRWMMSAGTDPAALLLPPGYLPGLPEPGGGSGSTPVPRVEEMTPDERLDRFLEFRGQAAGTLGAVIRLRADTASVAAAGNVPADTGYPTEAVIDDLAAGFIDGGSIRTLTSAATATIAQVPLDGHPHTARIEDAGDYRLMAWMEPDGQTITVTGLPMDEVAATLTEMAAVGAVVAVVGVLAAAIAGAAIIRVTLRPLNRVAATASRVAELSLDRGVVDLPTVATDVDTDPRTEVGQVGAALTRMLDHIGAAFAARHASETRMRQFLADASHELRTPLAAISGYAELTRRTHEAVPPDVAYAMRRVESESARMTALVSDLLLLARLDSGRPLVREPVDLTLLVVDAVNDAHVAAPDHRFELDLPGEPVTVPGDPARLHQVLANLLANARTHTPPGTRVTARLTVLDNAPGRPDSVPEGGPGGCVQLAVIDDGPGIPAHLLPQVFERFARGDSSRSRAAGSTGLGLSIVAAVVEAHNGRVEAASRPGRTAFTVALPLPPS